MLIRTRREFFKTTLKSAAGFGAAGMLAKLSEMSALAAGNYQALVCINLAGGNDGHNMVIPVTTAQQNYGAYQSARASLAIPQGSLLSINNGNDVYGLHPNMPEMKALYNSGKAAVVANVGTLVQPLTKQAYQSNNSALVPAQLFSHSDQTGQWQSAIPTGLASTGWGGRIEDALAANNAGASISPMTATTGCGLFCTGQQTFATTVPVGGASLLNNATGSRLAGVQQLLSFDNGLQLVQAANGVFNRGIGFSQALNAALANAVVTTPFPANNVLGQQLQTVAKVMAVRAQLGVNRQIFFCSLGGFDTHSAQAGNQDPLLLQLSRAVDAFYKATQELLVDQNVVTFTMSEFGRTLQPNGSAGTDHAWGSHHFVVGSAVQGGKFYGQFPSLALGGSDDANTRGTLIPTTSVDQYAATMAQWFGVGPANLGQVFPYVGNFPVNNLGFLG